MGVNHKRSADAVREHKRLDHEVLTAHRVPLLVLNTQRTLGLLWLNVVTNAFGDARSPELAAWFREVSGRFAMLADMVDNDGKLTTATDA